MRRILLGAWMAALASGADRWELQYFYDKDDSTLSFQDLQFASPEKGLALGVVTEPRRRRPVTLVTSDGGKSWNLLPLKETGMSLFFLHEGAGWMISDKKHIWKTTDAGRTWTQVPLSGIRTTPLRVFFLDESRGWLLCAEKQVYATADGGRSWQPLEAASRPDLPAERSLYTWATFAGRQIGLITGFSRGPERRSLVPPWMDPESIPLGRPPTDAMLLHSTDGGATWTHHVLRRLGELTRARISSGGECLLLLRRPDSLTVATEITTLDLKTLRGKSVYGERDRYLTDVAFAGPDRVFAAAVDQAGRTPFPAIPSKLRVLESRSPGFTRWTEMEVDYRAEAARAVLAAPGPAHAWIATDTGMILKWTRD